MGYKAKLITPVGTVPYYGTLNNRPHIGEIILHGGKQWRVVSIMHKAHDQALSVFVKEEK